VTPDPDDYRGTHPSGIFDPECYGAAGYAVGVPVMPQLQEERVVRIEARPRIAAAGLMAAAMASAILTNPGGTRMPRYSSKLRNSYCRCGSRDAGGRLLKGRECCFR
jgi:hypothetical protein